MSRFWFILSAAILLLVSTTLANDFISPRQIGMGRTMVLSQSSASTLANVPTGGLERSKWGIEAGYNRRFELADLDHLFVAGAYRRGKFTVAFGVSQFGNTDLYAEQLLKGSVAFQLDSVTVGGSLSAMQVQFGGGYEQLRAATFGLGASYRTSKLIAAFDADNLTSPGLSDTSPDVEPVYSLHAEFIGKGAFSVTGRLTLEGSQKAQLGLGQIISLSDRSSFFWGIASEPVEFGGGIELSLASGTFTYATSVHPVLGFSHTVTFRWGSVRKSKKRESEFD